jgi:hypothetical protein
MPYLEFMDVVRSRSDGYGHAPEPAAEPNSSSYGPLSYHLYFLYESPIRRFTVVADDYRW